ncbi:MAG: dTDP-4-dehydrorhamnose 3,5-epimerase [Sutterellaceae bacterium]|nr:dTDP-4-dehydrorhamnose 3,5-epimerase [Sutterellaceae bacterium]MDD7442959.1 dTDP-4-dehydrorhamnose 3,5-epimerase [Sutterellaceae bacterium]MDY2868428.1 dTDP-4-dehydrorhamnose 3,5-epimerase [Mesosutterella sp.]
MTAEYRNGPLPGLVIIRPEVHADSRGSFMEAWREEDFSRAVGHPVRFIQENESVSRRWVLRGLHLQAGASAQGKLVRCMSGRLFDVAVDLRPGSPAFLRWAGFTLDSAAPELLWIPAGFAHGFLALEDRTTLLYKVDRPWDPSSERCVRWDDPALGVRWPIPPGVSPVMSDRDRGAPGLGALLRELRGKGK